MNISAQNILSFDFADIVLDIDGFSCTLVQSEMLFYFIFDFLHEESGFVDLFIQELDLAYYFAFLLLHRYFFFNYELSWDGVD